MSSSAVCCLFDSMIGGSAALGNEGFLGAEDFGGTALAGEGVTGDGFGDGVGLSAMAASKPVGSSSTCAITFGVCQCFL